MLIGCVYLTFKELLNTLTEQQQHLTFLCVQYGVSSFSTFLPFLGNVHHCDFSHSCGLVVEFHFTFIYISLINNLLSSAYFPFVFHFCELFVQIFGPFKNLLFVFFIVDLKGLFVYPAQEPTCYIGKFFPQCIVYLFLCLRQCLLKRKLFNFDTVPFRNFYFIIHVPLINFEILNQTCTYGMKLLDYVVSSIYIMLHLIC